MQVDRSRFQAELLNAPHLLIAGETGSGKSVEINALLYALMSYSPKEKQVILIDPKKVELYQYRHIAHCIGYSDNPDKSLKLLQYAARLIDRRYFIMRLKGQKIYSGKDLYVIVDEYADMLLTGDRKEMEKLVQRIAQVGRAAKVHIILATQSPRSVVLKGTIKANIPNRLCFHTANKLDSRIILDQNGAENLKPYGQAIYMQPGKANELWGITMRSEEDIHALIKHWKG